MKNCDHICAECGAHETGSWMPGVMDGLVRKKLCFTCNFWYRLIEVNKDGHSVRIDGTHYRIAPEDRGGMRGFGGSLFIILFNDGRRVETTNLWHQGTVPDRFKDRLPDNAVFLEA